MMQASKQFGDSIKLVYEPDWPASEDSYTCIEGIDLMYQDLQEKLSDQVVEPLGQYLQKFPEIKNRIAKRDRRVLDYDRTKRALESGRKGQSTKLPQLEEQHAEAELLFNDINNDVHETLPSFYQARGLKRLSGWGVDVVFVSPSFYLPFLPQTFCCLFLSSFRSNFLFVLFSSFPLSLAQLFCLHAQTTQWLWAPENNLVTANAWLISLPFRLAFLSTHPCSKVFFPVKAFFTRATTRL